MPVKTPPFYGMPAMSKRLALSTALLSVLLATQGACRADDEADVREARALAQRLAQALGGELKAALAADGPAHAVHVCRDSAPRLAGELSRERGARVTRVSLKVRNPLLGTPDGWEREQLAEFDRRAAGGENPAALEALAWTEGPQGRTLRYLKALPVQPLCLACHGGEAEVAAPVAAQLAHDYPNDRARGYRAGEVRGAVSVTLPAGAGR